MSEPAPLTQYEQRQRIRALNLPDKVEKIALQVQRGNDQAKAKAELAAKLTELVQACAAASNDLLSLRASDPWSVSFSYLMNYSLAWLGPALHQDGRTVVEAMLANLRTLCSGAQERFPDGRPSLNAWQRAIAAFGEPAPVSGHAEDPHPYVDTLAKQILTVRNSGLGLPTLRQFYAPNGQRVHVIRPA